MFQNAASMRRFIAAQPCGHPQQPPCSHARDIGVCFGTGICLSVQPQQPRLNQHNSKRNAASLSWGAAFDRHQDG
jgi:hypothetical protein